MLRPEMDELGAGPAATGHLGDVPQTPGPGVMSMSLLDQAFESH